MLTVVLRRRQKFWFLTKEIAVLTTFQHQKVEITKNNPEMRIFMGGVISASEGEGCNFSSEGGCKFRAPARVCPLYTPPMLTCVLKDTPFKIHLINDHIRYKFKFHAFDKYT